MGWQHPGRNDFPPSCSCISEQSKGLGGLGLRAKCPAEGYSFQQCWRMAFPPHGAATPWLCKENVPCSAPWVGWTGWGIWAGLHRQEEQPAVLGAAVLAGLLSWRGGSSGSGC